MTLVYEERPSDSPYVEKIICGHTLADDRVIRPAETHWHMVFSTRRGQTYPLVVGPWSTAGEAAWTKDAEILWIKFKLGTFLPRLPTKKLLDSEIILPDASSKSFWLDSAAWQFPTYDNADTFVDRLVRNDVLVRDPVVDAALQDQLTETPSRTVRHRFLQAAGMSQNRIYQLQRAQRAMNLLQQGTPILDVVYQMGYADQPHLTRSLKQFTGYTPAQVAQTATT